MMDEIETKFHAFISFSSTSFDTTPDADNDDGEVIIPTVCLDGDFTLDDLQGIVVEFQRLLTDKSYLKKLAESSRFPLVFTEKG